MRNANWKWQPLGELFAIGAGKTMSEAARTGSHKVSFLRTSNVLWDDIDLTEVDEMSISPDELAAKSLRPGDLLVCEGGEIGRAAVWNGEREIMSFQNHLHRLRPLVAEVEPRFYVYFLQSAFTQLGLFEGAGNKTTIPNLSRNRLAALEIPVPSSAEQRSIVRVLGRTRGALRTHDISAKRGQELKRAAMQELFSRGLRGEPQKETEVGIFPETWKVDSLGAHHHLVSGGTPSRANPEFWEGGTIPWVKTTEIDYGLIITTAEQITPAGLEASPAKLLPTGTLLLAMYGQGITRGKVAMLGIEAACNQACAAIRPIDEEIQPRFLFHFLTHRYEALRQLSHGGQQQNLNLDIVRSFPVAYPTSDAEQKEIVEILDTIDRKIALHGEKKAVLEGLFKSLLHKLMTGEISVADLDLSAIEQTTERVPA